MAGPRLPRHDQQQHKDQPDKLLLREQAQEPNPYMEPNFQDQEQLSQPRTLIPADQNPLQGALWAAKLNLRLFSISSCTILLILVFTFSAGGEDASTTVVFFGPLAGLAFTWSFIETIFLCTKARRGFHPKTCMEVDLLLCFAFMSLSSLMGFFGPEPSLAQDRDDQHLPQRALSCFGVAEVQVRSHDIVCHRLPRAESWRRF
ncbi:hypothetical protein ACJZ2D_011221 [Fusarium nematophilum]